MIKSTVFFVLLVFVLVQCKHKHKKHALDVEKPKSAKFRHSNINEDPPYIDCIISGYFYCKGEASIGNMAYITSPEWPGQEISECISRAHGSYILPTTGWMILTEPVDIEINHICPIEGLSPMQYCAVPYYRTRVMVDQRNKTSIRMDINLDDPKHETELKCL